MSSVADMIPVFSTTNGMSTVNLIARLSFNLRYLSRLWVEPLVGPLKKRGALFRRARYGGEAEALDIYHEWETQGDTRIFPRD